MRRDWLTGGGLPGAVRIFGGFARARIVKLDREQFVSSGQGGFRVRCPAGAGNVTNRFVPAIGKWRAGGGRTMACVCGTGHDLIDLDYQPACGFAREWVELVDVGLVSVPEGLPEGVKVVLRRG